MSMMCIHAMLSIHLHCPRLALRSIRRQADVRALVVFFSDYPCLAIDVCFPALVDAGGGGEEERAAVPVSDVSRT